MIGSHVQEGILYEASGGHHQVCGRIIDAEMIPILSQSANCYSY